MGLRRYPGATPFRKDQAKIFYGRDRDIAKMLTLIKVEKKVLLYSKSGLGKTSLLEAGVIPKLKEKQPHYTSVSIRFYASKSEEVTPVERVLKALENSIAKIDDIPENLLDHLDDQEETKKSLWAYFKKLQLSGLSKNKDGKKKTFLLVFDQFEELFSYSKQEIETFKNEVYEITQPNIPPRFMSNISRARRKNRELFDADAIETLQESLNIKIVFAIRSDRLSNLNRLSDKITDIQDVFYEIHPLNEEQAREAIVNPAKDPSEDFDTSPYTFHQDATDKIITELTKKETGSENIETTQLQIVCHRIEEIAEQKKKTQSDGKLVEIQKDDLPIFKNIFLDFYEDSIQKLDESSRDKAKRMIEDELIRSKQRISLDENICKEFLTGEELKLLVDTHLLRAERNSFGRFSFELSHDTLVEPILDSKRKHDEEERLRKLEEKKEKERLEREKEVKQMQETQRRKTRWQRTIIAIVSLFLVVSLFLGYWGYENFCATAKESIKTMNKQREATLLYINFTNQQFIAFKEKGETSMKNAQYTKAIENFQEAKKNLHTLVAGKEIDTTSSCNIQELFTNSVKNEITNSITRYRDSLLPIARQDSIAKYQLISAKIDTCKSLASKASLISDLYDSARIFVGSKDYVNALKMLKKAYLLDPNKRETIKRFDNTKRDAIRFYESTRRNAAEIPDAAEVTRASRLLNQVNNIQL